MQEYAKTDQTLHQLSQVLAKANRTFVPKEEDDSHVNLYYDHLGSRILGRWINTSRGQIMLGLNLSDYVFVWYDSSFKELKKYPISGRTTIEIEVEIEQDLSSLDLKKEGFRNELHFDIGIYPFKDNVFSVVDKSGLKSWMHYRNLANKASLQILGTLQQSSEIRIWPHHFDTGVYALVPDKIGIGFGLAMEDMLAEAPYFYIVGYPNKGVLDYSETTALSLGKWITRESWQGAILPINELDAMSSIEIDNSVDAFITETTCWFLK